MAKEILRDEKGRIMDGSGPLNPEGRPSGAKHFTTLVIEAMERKLGEDGEGMSKNEFLAEALSELLITGKFTTVDGTEINMRSGDFLNFIMNVWKKLEPGVSAIDITSGGERLDFARMEDVELRRVIQTTIRNSFASADGSGEAWAESEDSESGFDSGGISSDDSPEDISMGHETP